MTLAELPIGQSANVMAVHGERGFRRRLLELGLVPGTAIEVLRVAPLGDPIAIRVRGSSLSIRRTEARGVELCAAESPADAGEPEPSAGGPLTGGSAVS